MTEDFLARHTSVHFNHASPAPPQRHPKGAELLELHAAWGVTWNRAAIKELSRRWRSSRWMYKSKWICIIPRVQSYLWAQHYCNRLGFLEEPKDDHDCWDTRVFKILHWPSTKWKSLFCWDWTSWNLKDSRGVSVLASRIIVARKDHYSRDVHGTFLVVPLIQSNSVK